MRRLIYIELSMLLLLPMNSAPQVLGGGGFHSLVVCGNAQNTVLTCGQNSSGECGQGTVLPNNILTPINVQNQVNTGNLINVWQVEAAQFHSLAILNDSTVLAWGSNINGKIGNNTVPLGNNQTLPIVVQGSGGVGTLDSIVQVDAGNTFTLALHENGTVWAWGNNANGQIGQGVVGGIYPTPVQVTGLPVITAVSAGPDFALAIAADSTVWTWGSDNTAALGTGGIGGDYSTPIQNASLTQIVQVSGGMDHSLFLDVNGNVYSCGFNWAGQTGVGGAWGYVTPTAVQGIGGGGALTGVTEISTGEGFSVALMNTANVVAWGLNNNGMLGDGTLTNRNFPNYVVDMTGGPGSLANVLTLRCGLDHTLAINTSNQVIAWGMNFAGQIGIGTSSAAETVPVLMMLPCLVVPLPIDLIEFDAYANNDQVDIKWITATETDNDYFTIEKSIDGVNFQKLRDVPGAGTSSETIAYFEIDQNPHKGISYYRLKQTDYNGTTTTFDIVVVKFDGYEQEVIVYPNPTTGNINLSVNDLKDDNLLLVLRNIEGKEVYSKAFHFEDENGIISIDLKNRLAPGTYLITGASNHHLFQRKLMVK